MKDIEAAALAKRITSEVSARITREVHALIERALDPVRGRGLLPLTIDGRPAQPLERVRAVAERLATWDADVNALAAAIVNHPTLRKEIRAGESAIAFATRKLLETPR